MKQIATLLHKLLFVMFLVDADALLDISRFLSNFDHSTASPIYTGPKFCHQ